LYVDDLLVTSTHIQSILDLKAYLESLFPEVAYHSGKIIDYVGMTFDFASKPGAAVVTMKHLINDVLTFAPEGKIYRTPACPDLFEIDPTSPKLVGQSESTYLTVVAKLLYMAKRHRPDILLAIGFLTTRSTFCTEEDLVKLYHVLGYVLGTIERGIIIEFGDNPRPRAWIDASYGIHERDGKSHTGASIVFGTGGPLYVTSTKQSIVTKSSTEAELIAFSDVASEVISLRNFAIDQGYPTTPAVIYQDNMSTMSLVANGGSCSKRSRHIDIRYFWMAAKVADGSIEVIHCPTANMWANFLTKPIGGAQLVFERQGLTNWHN
jgi:hypothetical protein